MFHKVKAVRPLPEYTLLVEFRAGERKRYPVLPLLRKFDAFRAGLTTTGPRPKI